MKLEQETTTKNDLGVDTISRDAVLKPYEGLKDDDTISVWLIRKNIEQQPSVKQEPILDKIDEIITDALDKSTDQKESQTLRWVLDKISEVVEDGTN